MNTIVIKLVSLPFILADVNSSYIANCHDKTFSTLTISSWFKTSKYLRLVLNPFFSDPEVFCGRNLWSILRMGQEPALESHQWKKGKCEVEWN